MNIYELCHEYRLYTCLLLSLVLALAWIKNAKVEIPILILTITMGILLQTRFGQFHIPMGHTGPLNGTGTLIHVNDVLIYQMGSKYFKETGYEGFYKAIAQSLATINKETEIKFKPLGVRDLSNKNEPLKIFSTLQVSKQPPKFTEERWEEFKRDIKNWETMYTPHWPTILGDYGYNASPFTTLLGSIINTWIPTKHPQAYL